MSTYAIGDIQGCFEELSMLLNTIHFSPTQDKLWLVGDLVNRGPDSLATLRYAKSLGNQCQIVLGNHELHLLALAALNRPPKRHDTLEAILAAEDREGLLNWLRHQPLLFHDATYQYTLVHAGIFPAWDLPTAQSLANEVETILQGDDYLTLLQHLYGDQPDQWDKSLHGFERYRFIINTFTRMRYCDQQGRLVLAEKRPPDQVASNLIPWFRYPQRATQNHRIIFGHFAALNGQAHTPNIFALDTGCCWGNQLTAMRLEDQTFYHVEKQ